MSSYFRIYVYFLGGYYHGKEWPPSPMRLMQAIVAGSAHIGHLSRYSSTLFWLEQLEPPMIYGSRVESGMEFTAYVPRNSDDITLRDYYKDMPSYKVQANRRARYDGQPTRRRWVNEPITYEWCVDNVAQAQRLGELGHELVCLGRAEDLAFARFELSDQPLENGSSIWCPLSKSSFMRNPLRIPTSGSLSSLTLRERARRRRSGSKEYVDPPIVYDERSYDCGTSLSQRPYFLYNLHAFGRDDWLSWRHNEGVTIAAMIRHALSTRVSQSSVGYATGHTEDGILDDRLSWIPLPTIGHRHADGRIRRAMVLGPEGERYDSDRFREIRHALAHAPLLQHGTQVGTIDETDEISGAVHPYLEAGTHWHTVTPLITHGRTTRGGKQKGKFDRHKAEKLILHALAKAGLPVPVDMHFQSAPFERSGRAAREYRVPHYLSGLSRFHVSVIFSEPVSGPILAGVGRHYGLGLLCNAHEAA